MIVDTQIVSYRFKGNPLGNKSASNEISSVTASEFLLFKTGKNNKPDYYVLHPARYAHFMSGMLLTLDDCFKNQKWGRRGVNRTDSFTIDFNNQFVPYRIFGNKAIKAKAI